MGNTHSSAGEEVRRGRAECATIDVPEADPDRFELEEEKASCLAKAPSVSVSQFDMDRLLRLRLTSKFTDSFEADFEHNPYLDISAAIRAGYDMTRRKRCQDFVVVKRLTCSNSRVYALLAVFDGHGAAGRDVAKGASDIVSSLLSEKLNEHDELTALTKTFRKLHRLIENRDGPFANVDSWTSGTTATCILLRENRMFVANVGDTAAYLVEQVGSAYKALELHVPHNFERAQEVNRVQKTGGLLKRIGPDKQGPLRVFNSRTSAGPGLAISRSLGDLHAHNLGVSCEPALLEMEIKPTDKFIVLGSDGIWDVRGISSVARHIVDFKRVQSDGSDSPNGHSCAEALALECSHRWICRHLGISDDISVVVAAFQGANAEEHRSIMSNSSKTQSSTDPKTGK